MKQSDQSKRRWVVLQEQMTIIYSLVNKFPIRYTCRKIIEKFAARMYSLKKAQPKSCTIIYQQFA